MNRRKEIYRLNEMLSKAFADLCDKYPEECWAIDETTMNYSLLEFRFVREEPNVSVCTYVNVDDETSAENMVAQIENQLDDHSHDEPETEDEKLWHEAIVFLHENVFEPLVSGFENSGNAQTIYVADSDEKAELLGQLIDVVEDWLDTKGLDPADFKDDYDLEAEYEGFGDPDVFIAGPDYDKLKRSFENALGLR